MRILHVNHGYPMRYNAGSEVYARNLAQAHVQDGQEVAVFAREEDPHRPEYALQVERDGAIGVHLINLPRTWQRFEDASVDAAFGDLVDAFEPDAVHFHHLNHLSIGLPQVAHDSGAVVVYTVHDFWLPCPRGQLIRWSMGSEPWPLCDKQQDARCARECFARAFTGLAERYDEDVRYWLGWVRARMSAVQRQLAFIDCFACPSRTVADALVRRFPEVEDRVVMRDYGFPEAPLTLRKKGGPFTFGFLGTHTAPKGVDQLIRAFATLKGDVRLQVWGRARGLATEALRQLAGPMMDRVSFPGEYVNGSVFETVLPGLDVVVVPSIWLENSPLVIHEAQQARVCVVTANAGGMAEYVQDGVNGLLFRHRDEKDLARVLQRLVDEHGLAARLGSRGYLGTPDGRVPTMTEDAAFFADLYARLGTRRERRVLP